MADFRAGVGEIQEDPGVCLIIPKRKCSERTENGLYPKVQNKYTQN